jgi:hypothetical protein
MKAPSPLDVTKLSPPVDISDNEAALNGVAEVVAQGPFRDTWESLSGYSVPAWYRDANPRNMYRAGTAEYAHHLVKFPRLDGHPTLVVRPGRECPEWDVHRSTAKSSGLTRLHWS